MSHFEGAFGGTCERVRLDSGGYDKGGAYWGSPSNLWYVRATDAADEEIVEAYVRAPSRDAAKAKFPKSMRWKR